MPIEVYDFHSDVRNIVVMPEIRGRFLRMEPGTVAGRHSHDLGHEMFLILEGQCDFEIEGEHAILGPGQACFARRDQMHQVRVVGDQPMTMYLSVTPHLEPTHTQWTADPHEGGQKLPPRYETWRNREHDRITDPTAATTELVDRHLAAVRALADQATASADQQEAIAAALKQAMSASNSADARRQVDALWASLYPLFRAVSALGEAWNELAPKATK
jgi:quercetin dioxygenase-like cupin family protein